MKSSLGKLFGKNPQRAELLKQIQFLLDFGSEEDFLELLITWKIPVANRAGLLDEFRRQQRAKRGLDR